MTTQRCPVSIKAQMFLKMNLRRKTDKLCAAVRAAVFVIASGESHARAPVGRSAAR